jgi:anti-anti-sigma factor
MPLDNETRAAVATRIHAMASQPAEFSIDAANRDGWVCAALRGELDLATAPELEGFVNEQLDSGTDVVIDLRQLEFMDSSGVRVLVAAHARAGREGRRLTVVRPGPDSAVGKIIDVSGLDAELRIVDDPGPDGA